MTTAEAMTMMMVRIIIIIIIMRFLALIGSLKTERG